jgi:hypothetical protein
MPTRRTRSPDNAAMEIGGHPNHNLSGKGFFWTLLAFGASVEIKSNVSAMAIPSSSTDRP